MLREKARRGRVSYLNFYRRRFRRINPASTLVLAATVLASYWIYRPAARTSFAPTHSGLLPFSRTGISRPLAPITSTMRISSHPSNISGHWRSKNSCILSGRWSSSASALCLALAGIDLPW